MHITTDKTALDIALIHDFYPRPRRGRKGFRWKRYNVQLNIPCALADLLMANKSRLPG
jgi:hypothetical protein